MNIVNCNKIIVRFVFYKKAVLKNSAILIFVGVSFIKVADLKTCNFVKTRSQHRCFSVNIAKFLRTSI